MDIDPVADLAAERVIGCAITVHETLGPGLLESIYRDCLVSELLFRGLAVECEVRVPIEYRGRRIRDDLRIDLLVEGRLVVEVKSVELMKPVHRAQVMTYLKLAGKPSGLLLNFNECSLRAGLRRVDHPEVYAKRRQAGSVFVRHDRTGDQT